MTASPKSPPQVFADVDEAIRSLRASGLRLSTPRRLVLEALFEVEGPVSAAHLSRTLSLDESSVYRTLEVLEQRGVVHHVHLGHSPGLYVLASEQQDEYLYCERCAKVTALAPERLDSIREHLQGEFGYTPRFAHFAIVGTCQECAATPQPPAQGGSASPQHHAAGTSRRARSGGHQHLHSHGGYVHSHPHAHPGRGPHHH